jgi:two-component system chemotaxis response regulator CheY
VRALIVDDSRAMRTILKGILKGLGFETFEAGHGKEALERLKEVGATDLALVDWNMPEMNGLEFVQAVRAQQAYEETRLVMITTETDMARVTAALEAGANEYLMKPFTKESMLDKLTILGLAGPPPELGN